MTSNLRPWPGLKIISLGLACFLYAAAAGAQNYDPAYETRAQEIIAGLSRLNGLRGWTAETPAAWPAGAGFNNARPAALAALNLVNQGLGRAADFSGLAALQYLDLSGNNLRGLNLAEAPALESLTALKNQLSELDVRGAPLMSRLALSGNDLNRLDLSANPRLTSLFVSMNQLTALTLNLNPELLELEAMNNRLTGLDLSANPRLTRLLLAYNRLAELDLSANPELAELGVRGNALARLDLSRNPALRLLSAGRNQLRDLELSHNPELTRLEVGHNELTRLDLQQNHKLTYLDAQGNPLTELRLSEEALAALESLNLDGARLPLSALAPLTGRAKTRARFGTQSLALFETRRLNLREVLDLTAEARFDGAPTTFIVLNDKKRRVRPSCYSLDGGLIRFNVPGRYQIQMTNPKVFSSEKNRLTSQPRAFKATVLTGYVEVAPPAGE